MTDLDLEAIKARCERVTVGPWQFYQDGNTGWVAADDEPEAAIAQTVRLQDAEFIAHARTDVPALVAAVERQGAIIAALEGLAARWDEFGPESEAERVFGKQVVSVEFAVTSLQTVLATTSDSGSTGGQL